MLAVIGRRARAVTIAGLITGLADALTAPPLIAAQLWEVTPTEGPTLVIVSLLVASVALLASFVPVRRERVDPTIALKQE